jgi:hypothetical protein
VRQVLDLLQHIVDQFAVAHLGGFLVSVSVRLAAVTAIAAPPVVARNTSILGPAVVLAAPAAALRTLVANCDGQRVDKAAQR